MKDIPFSQYERNALGPALYRETLERLLVQAEHHLQDVARRDGQLQPMLFTISAGGLSIYSSGPLSGESQKSQFRAVTRLICAAQGAFAAVMAVEARFIESKSEERVGSIVVPACSPDREEHLYLVGEAVGGVHERRFLPILRDHCGRITRLGPATELPPGPAEGRLPNLLPQCPITDEVRTFAAAMLQANYQAQAESRHPDTQSDTGLRLDPRVGPTDCRLFNATP
jgi:hypothetical protein